MLRGVILAGGTGSRLGALTRVTNKHLLPVYDMPMIFYPIKKLVGAGITNILIVTGTEHMGDFVRLIGSGREFGASVTYRVQDEAGGIAQALGLASDWGGPQDRYVVLLSDNIFEDPIPLFCLSPSPADGAWVATKKVKDAGRFGVVRFKLGEGITIEEKPNVDPNVPFEIVTGVYSYPRSVFDLIGQLKPSGRGELEITDVNNYFAKDGKLHTCELEGYWTDAGTIETLHEASQLVKQTPPRW